MLTHEELGRRLKEARTNSGMTQAEVCERLGISRPKLIAMEKGDGAIDTVLLANMAQLYGYSMEYFVSFELQDDEMTLAFRSSDVTQVSQETINWARKVLFNVSAIEEICKEIDGI